ncbi:uncharacterized protein LOC141850950 [Brevipalpus obovatus]|uniref:uncharacterized protein LOC141850950 n=1 Tax=Brevipalpus obovatus TaxID=246614 RepID=UPI003D9E4D4D
MFKKMSIESVQETFSMDSREKRSASMEKFRVFINKLKSKDIFFFSNIAIWLMVMIMFFVLLNVTNHSQENLDKYLDKLSLINEQNTRAIVKEENSWIHSDLNMMKRRLDPLGDLLYSKNATFPAIEEMRRQISRQMIPIGFIYTQLPFQSSPALLWPWAKWMDITANYSGYFFRAEGNGSAPFGVAQDDAFRQHQHSIDYININLLPSISYGNGIMSDNHGYKYSHRSSTGNITSLSSQFISDTETRPKNFAVRIWIRSF